MSTALILGGTALESDPDQFGPVISSLQPPSGPPGTAVTISGKNFTPTAGFRGSKGGGDDYGGNMVHFGSDVTIKNINSSDGITLKFEVPQSVAPGTYNVSVVNSKGASNTVSFQVTKD
jgi:uncharacterized protein (TIGR03437 family)